MFTSTSTSCTSRQTRSHEPQLAATFLWDKSLSQVDCHNVTHTWLMPTFSGEMRLHKPLYMCNAWVGMPHRQPERWQASVGGYNDKRTLRRPMVHTNTVLGT